MNTQEATKLVQQTVADEREYILSQLWALEKKINDGCSRSLDLDTVAKAFQEFKDSLKY